MHSIYVYDTNIALVRHELEQYNITIPPCRCFFAFNQLFAIQPELHNVCQRRWMVSRCMCQRHHNPTKRTQNHSCCGQKCGFVVFRATHSLIGIVRLHGKIASNIFIFKQAHPFPSKLKSVLISSILINLTIQIFNGMLKKCMSAAHCGIVLSAIGFEPGIARVGVVSKSFNTQLISIFVIILLQPLHFSC